MHGEDWVSLSVTAACWREREWPTVGRSVSHQTQCFVDLRQTNKLNFKVVTQNPTWWRKKHSTRSAPGLLCRWSEACGWVCLWWRRRQTVRCPPGICNLMFTHGQRKQSRTNRSISLLITGKTCVVGKWLTTEKSHFIKLGDGHKGSFTPCSTASRVSLVLLHTLQASETRRH